MRDRCGWDGSQAAKGSKSSTAFRTSRTVTRNQAAAADTNAAAINHPSETARPERFTKATAKKRIQTRHAAPTRISTFGGRAVGLNHRYLPGRSNRAKFLVITRLRKMERKLLRHRDHPAWKMNERAISTGPDTPPFGDLRRLRIRTFSRKPCASAQRSSRGGSDRLVDIGEDVVDVLDANREADEFGRDPGGEELFAVELGVGCGRRMDRQ